MRGRKDDKKQTREPTSRIDTHLRLTARKAGRSRKAAEKSNVLRVRVCTVAKTRKAPLGWQGRRGKKKGSLSPSRIICYPQSEFGIIKCASAFAARVRTAVLSLKKKPSKNCLSSGTPSRSKIDAAAVLRGGKTRGD